MSAALVDGFHIARQEDGPRNGLLYIVYDPTGARIGCSRTKRGAVQIRDAAARLWRSETI